MNVGSRQQRQMIAWGFRLSAAKNLVDIRTGSSQRQRQVQLEKVQNQQTSTYVPRRVNDT